MAKRPKLLWIPVATAIADAVLLLIFVGTAFSDAAEIARYYRLDEQTMRTFAMQQFTVRLIFAGPVVLILLAALIAFIFAMPWSRWLMITGHVVAGLLLSVGLLGNLLGDSLKGLPATSGRTELIVVEVLLLNLFSIFVLASRQTRAFLTAAKTLDTDPPPPPDFSS